jgi:TolA-binding protein
LSLERLEINPFPNIIREILQDRRSGILTLVASGSRRIIHWAYGDVVLVESDRPEEMLHNYLLKQSSISRGAASELEQAGSRNAALHFAETEMVPPAARHSLLRQWMSSVLAPLFSLDAGTAAFDEGDPLAPEERVFVSTPALVLEGIRTIQSGLVLRSSLGDLKREIEPVFDPPYEIETLPLTSEERGVAEALEGPTLLQDFLKTAPVSSVVASRTVIAMFTFGLCREVVHRQVSEGAFDTTQQDMQILSAIAGDQNALEAVALSRQMERLDHYRFLDVPKAATRTQIVLRTEALQRKFDPGNYPPIVRDAVLRIRKRIDEALALLQDSEKRHAYDELLETRHAGASPRSIEQQAARRSLARQNYRKADELFLKGDYHTAIVLLEQTVKFEPNNADAWHLLGMNQRNNPNWRRNAADSFHRALSIDPSRLETMIALGDLYFEQKMPSRARNFYEEALRTDPESDLVKSRLKKVAKA